MKLTMLGTGNATVTEVYNTCFVISDDKWSLMVDGGGGNTILHQLKAAGIKWSDMRRIFVTHKHLDHIMGIIWMVRMFTQNISRGNLDCDVYIYGHDEVITLIRDISSKLLNGKEVKVIDDRLHLIEVHDGETVDIDGRTITFFDIQSTKAKQYGFSMMLDDGSKFTCCGEEPFNEYEREYAIGSKWLLHEAFCLYSQADVFKPYEKNHSTVKDACELAESLGVSNLVLYHTEDKNIDRRKELYIAEGSSYFSGNLFVPEDLEVLEL